jgi:hypothetical protein
MVAHVVFFFILIEWREFFGLGVTSYVLLVLGFMMIDFR